MKDGKIFQIGPHIDLTPGDTVTDVTGCIVFPGFIDAHTHLQMHNGVTNTADDFASGTRAALCGGTTTIIDFAAPDGSGALLPALEKWKAMAHGVSSCHYAFHMSITRWNRQVREELPQLYSLGVRSFKAYMAYDHLQLDDDALLEILHCLKPLGGILGVHCENGSLIRALQRQILSCGITGPEGHALSRPAEVEAEAVHRLCFIAGLAKMPVHVVHLSSKLGLEQIRLARQRGQTVHAETCPQYLLLDDSRYRLPGFEGAKYVLSPPLRSAGDAAALRDAVQNGEIETISTDHCSFNFAGQKALGIGDFTKIPNGCPSVEHRPGLMLTAFANLPLYRMAQLMSENAARLFGLYPRKGALLPGSDADITVWDPAKSWTITAEKQHQRVDYTPYEGFPVSGQVKYVYLNGVLAAKDAQPVGTCFGSFVPMN